MKKVISERFNLLPLEVQKIIRSFLLSTVSFLILVLVDCLFQALSKKSFPSEYSGTAFAVYMTFAVNTIRLFVSKTEYEVKK